MKVVDKDLNLDLDMQLELINTYPIQDMWLMKQIVDSTKKCFALAESMPSDIVARTMDLTWGKIDMFLQCEEESRKVYCMENDTKKMLEKHFSPLEDLVIETGMDEETLLMLAQAIIDESYTM